VTVTYNSADVLDAFLRCVQVQTHEDFMLYVVDNASKDQTLEIARNWTDRRLRIIANLENLGVAEGNNQGIRSAIADGCHAVLLINNDTEFPATLIQRLADGLDAHAVEMTCPKMMYYSESSRIWAAGGTLQPLFGYRSVHFGENEIDRGQYDTARLVTYVPTCCVLIRSDVFRRIGVMDKHYFVYADDTDFMYRAFKAGIRLMYLPEIQLLHKVGGLTGGKLSAFSVRYTARNRTYFLLRHCGFLAALTLLIAYQSYFAASLILRRIDFRIYSIKERAVWEGIQLWRRRRSEVAAQCQL
jgi:GT2 family glycosyltransferase